jgi:hypothetical protein
MDIAINWWAIIVSMLSSVVLGMIWYGPLFGKKWMALSGIVMPADKKPCMKDMVKPIVISLVGAFFMSFTLIHSLTFAQAYPGMEMSAVAAGLQAAFWNWLGFMVPVNLSFVAWEGKPWTLFFIHSGYWLVLLGVMGVVLSVWK